MSRPGGVARTRAERERLYGWVYENNQWGCSPAGARYYSDSPPELTTSYRELVGAFIQDHDVRRVVDLGCGDFVLAGGIDMGEADYIGVDIYPGLIAHNTAHHGDHRHAFVVADLIEDELPAADMAILSMVLYLMSHADTLVVLRKLRRYRYVLITDGQPDIVPAERRNIDKPTDKYTPRDWNGNGLWLELPPFNLELTTLHEYRMPDGEIARTILLEHPLCVSL